MKIGITDYEYFGKKEKKSAFRREGHRHFWASGSPAAVLQVVDVFKGAIPFALWFDDAIAKEVRRGWPRLPTDTYIRKVLLQDADRAMAMAAQAQGTTRAGASSESDV